MNGDGKVGRIVRGQPVFGGLYMFITVISRIRIAFHCRDSDDAEQSSVAIVLFLIYVAIPMLSVVGV